MTDIKNNKEIFIMTLKENCKNRFDVDKFINYLENQTDFFTAPASTKYHLSEKGGLLQHSLNVYECLIRLIDEYNINIDIASITICGLLHDICKANFYKQELKNVKVGATWTQQLQYVVDDQFPIGHGEKSVIILQQFMTLTKDEIIAIRWHMSGFDYAVKAGDYAYSKAVSICQLLSLLEIADMTASRILEANNDKN